MDYKHPEFAILTGQGVVWVDKRWKETKTKTLALGKATIEQLRNARYAGACEVCDERVLCFSFRSNKGPTFASIMGERF